MALAVTVLTGGAGGIGLASAKNVARDHAVVICDISPTRLAAAADALHTLGITCRPVLCDITDKNSVSDLVGSATDLGHVDAVIHTAGVSPSMATVQSIMRVNALGTLNITEAFYDIATPGFALVNVASMASYMLPRILTPTACFNSASSDAEAFVARMVALCKIVPDKYRSGLAYCLSKRFTRWYSSMQAKRFGAKGARILSVSPGSIDTEMGQLEEQTGSGAIARSSGLRRFGTADEIAELLIFCASDKASYLTGTDILCDGGAMAALGLRDKLAVSRNL